MRPLLVAKQIDLSCATVVALDRLIAVYSKTTQEPERSTDRVNWPNKSSIDEHHSRMGNHDASMPAKSCVMLGGSQFSLVIQSLTSSSWILMHNRATETGSSASCVVLATAIS